MFLVCLNAASAKQCNEEIVSSCPILTYNPSRRGTMLIISSGGFHEECLRENNPKQNPLSWNSLVGIVSIAVKFFWGLQYWDTKYVVLLELCSTPPANLCTGQCVSKRKEPLFQGAWPALCFCKSRFISPGITQNWAFHIVT